MKLLLSITLVCANACATEISPPIVAPARILPSAEPLQARDVIRAVFVERSALPPAIAVQVADALMDEAIATGVDPVLVLAMIEVESGWQENAVSPAGARGYLQLMPKTRRWLLQRETDLLHLIGTEQDVRIAVRYFAMLQSTFGRVDRALQAYNCGPGCLLAAEKKRIRLPKETRDYPKKVLALQAQYRRVLDEAMSSVLTSTTLASTAGPAPH